MEADGQSFILASFPKNNLETICTGTSEWKGKNLLFVRTFDHASEDGSLVPTRAWNFIICMKPCARTPPGMK